MLVIVKAKFKRVISVPVSRAMEPQLSMPCASILCDSDSSEGIQGRADVAMIQPKGHVPLHTVLSIFNRNDSQLSGVPIISSNINGEDCYAISLVTIRGLSSACCVGRW